MEETYDVIIVGCGAAGLSAAMNLPAESRVLMVCKQELTLCNSALAQGGIAAVYHAEGKDSIETHIQDTMVAGGFENNPETLEILAASAEDTIQTLLDIGVDFDKTADGDFHRTLEGGHTRHRIFHYKDKTGAEILRALAAHVRSLPNVTIREKEMLFDVRTSKTGFSVLLSDESVVHCHYLIFATGGIGRIYRYTTNSKIATGDGITFAYELGAKIQDLHLVQFHPTAFHDDASRECFLISEAVRGEGAYLLNCNRERFMQRYDERLELAPRDVVSRSILLESRRTNSDDFYLDISRLDSDFIRARFPMIYETVLEHGFDMTREPIPIFPCQHYLMGGIAVDENSRTTLPRLYAAGECACTGVHGNNRLASNSLLEAIVFGRRAAEDIAAKLPETESEFQPETFPPQVEPNPLPTGLRTEIRKIMQESYFVLPDEEKLRENFPRVKEIAAQLRGGNYQRSVDFIEAKSLATVAEIIFSEVLGEILPEK